jgi:hypothetical protein
MQIFQPHLPFSLIADIAEGRRVPDVDAQAHLDTCPACAADLAWLARTMTAMRADTSEEPGARAVGDVKALFRARVPRPASPLSAIAALLHFDSARAVPAFGLRTGGTTERQLIFSAGPYDVDLRVTSTGDRYTVAGQLLGNILAGPGQAEITGPADADHAELSPESEFVFRPLRPGTYSLTIRFDEQLIVLRNVEIGI